MHRFYVPASFESERIDVAGDEAAHMLRVLRLTVGTQVMLFDGRGNAAVAEIQEVQKRSARLRICERLPGKREIGPKITLLTAVPKSDRFRWLVEKATELGIDRLIPVRTERSVVHPGQGKLEKMEAASIAACKQCGRNDLLTIEPLQDWADVLDTLPPAPLWVADPHGQPLREVRFPAASEEVVLAVGPEGGFTDDEIDLAIKAGAARVRLGSSILRIETAAVAFAAWARIHSDP